MKCFKFKCKVRSWPTERVSEEGSGKECQTVWTAWTDNCFGSDWRKQSQNNLNDLAKITLPSPSSAWLRLQQQQRLRLRLRLRLRHPPVTPSSFLMPVSAAPAANRRPRRVWSDCDGGGIESKLQKPNSTNAGAQFGINNEAQSTDGRWQLEPSNG
ncbi:hypothetical protein AWZ03_003753 [Drosophila navojoa]|uniref:Uncharacterized protein n=1 Tax=Drosophila navojoa TaxID=7232 RepID=A0A484BPF8_DRONA|nr:hypothetical protein AWZ03_003753 [Drosophila navojoa]